jgi:hypothetical protein
MIVTARASEAAKEFLIAANLSTVSHIYAELEDAESGNAQITREFPCVGCFGTDASEFPPRSGNYRLNLHVMVAAKFDDCDATTFDAMCTEVFNKIHTDSIHSDLTAALANFTCFAIAGSVNQIPDVDAERRLRRMDLVLPLYACCSDIAA